MTGNRPASSSTRWCIAGALPVAVLLICIIPVLVSRGFDPLDVAARMGRRTFGLAAAGMLLLGTIVATIAVLGATVFGLWNVFRRSHGAIWWLAAIAVSYCVLLGLIASLIMAIDLTAERRDPIASAAIFWLWTCGAIPMTGAWAYALLCRLLSTR